jgi:antitoxin (DNA-binding transcriptional repressor) of toxin-antitoxin stability system
MITIEINECELLRRLPSVLSKARRGIAVIITAPGKPAVTLSLARPKDQQAARRKPINWNVHFAWLKTQPESRTNPVDDLRAGEQR